MRLTYIHLIPKYVLSRVRVHVYEYNIIIITYKICCSTAFLVYPVAREVRSALSTPESPTHAVSPSLRMFNPPYFVCVQGFPLKFWKGVNYYRYKPSGDCSNGLV